MRRIRRGFVSFIGNRVQDTIDCYQASAADITTANTIPVPMIPAPGLNKVIAVESAIVQFRYSGVQFTGGGILQLVYHGATVNLLTGGVPAAVIQAAASSITLLGAAASSLTAPLNTGVDLYAATANFAAGNSTAIITVKYSIYEKLDA